MRLITSPILSNDDSDAIILSNEDDPSVYANLKKRFLEMLMI